MYYLANAQTSDNKFAGHPNWQGPELLIDDKVACIPDGLAQRRRELLRRQAVSASVCVCVRACVGVV